MPKKPERPHSPPKTERAKERPHQGDVSHDTVDRDSDDSFPASDPPSTTPVTGPRRHHDC